MWPEFLLPLVLNLEIRNAEPAFYSCSGRLGVVSGRAQPIPTELEKPTLPVELQSMQYLDPRET